MKLHKSFYLVFGFYLLAATTFGQASPTDSLKAIVSAIDSANIYEMKYTVGFAPRVSNQYLRYCQLLRLATSSDLLALATHHENGVVRLYAFQALRRKKVDMPVELTERFRSDSTVIGTSGGIAKMYSLVDTELDWEEPIPNRKALKSPVRYKR